jgi:hypothetical protein
MSALLKPRMAPYGWELQGSHLEPIAQEQLVLRHVRLHAAFGARCSEIAKNLNNDGFFSEGHLPWTASDIEELLSFTDEPLWQDWLEREMSDDF